jgi:P pilus assembly chaperone PapD
MIYENLFLTKVVKNSFLAIALVMISLPLKLMAAGFEVAVTPSRFELDGKSSQRIGQSLTIHNLGSSETEVSMRTIDWEYSPEGQISYFDELRPNSCRPWVTLERRGIKIPARSKRTFRFQVDVPESVARGECRFMIAIEGVEPAHTALIQSGGASLSMPVNGRIAVPVYFAVSGAEPKLELLSVETIDINGKRTAVVKVVNNGDAHGRLEGSLEARDAKDVAFELTPEGTPIMPGQTRVLPLLPMGERNRAAPAVVMPFKADGTLDWEHGAFKVNAEFK